MSKKDVEALLIKGGEDRDFRVPYDAAKDRDDFVALAKKDGFDFTVDELNNVLAESGDPFESYGNPPKRSIWWV